MKSPSTNQPRAAGRELSGLQPEDEPGGVENELPQGDVTDLLARWAAGDAAAAGDLMPLVYDELRRIAHGFLGRERTEHTLQPTAVVHEAFLRLVGQRGLGLESRAQFIGVAARVMRQVLVDYSRSRNAAKRGGDQRRITLVEAAAVATPVEIDFLDLHEALERLEKLDRQMAGVVELRFFGGATIEEIAAELGVSDTTVSRLWRRAKAWLYQALGETAATPRA